MKRLLYRDGLDVRASAGMLALRLMVGTAFMIHGWKKIQNPFGWMGDKTSVPGVFQALAAISEFGGGAAWIIGALVPLASLGILCTMTVAAYTHISREDPFAKWELASVYFCVAVLLLLAGPGIFYVDKVFFGRRSTPA